ncbi:hypothetical protein AB6A40_000279 [Gnathostoma spinigerum]|uniref:Uncharacterized protein n=1 Tax=Gnathostoma spinigerum TaxID=75299 RepID=A0ABD6E2Q4_9BILA
MTPSGACLTNPNLPYIAQQQLTTSVNQMCICDRPLCHIVCTRCGFELTGRLQRVCPVHPKKLALMDLRECGNKMCRSVHLVEVPIAQ